MMSDLTLRRPVPWWFIPTAVLILSLVPASVITLAHAAESLQPPLEQRLEEKLQQQPLPQVYLWLRHQELPPLQRHDQLRWLGQMAMQLDDHAAAVDHYERLVLLDPMDLGSRLDLALAYAELGNAAAARASLEALDYYLQQAEGSARLPAAAARAIEELEARLDNAEGQHASPSSDIVSQLRGSLTVGQGYDSNANLGARSRSIPLSLWGEIPMTMELADESLAQPSHYSSVGGRVSLPLEAVATAPEGDWQLLAGGEYRHYHQLDQLHRRDVYVGGQWQPTDRQQQLSVLALHQHVDGLPSQWSLVSDYRRLIGPHWLSSLGVQWQDEPHRSSSQTLRAGLWREWQQFLLHGQVSWQFRPGRPSGDTRRLAARVDTPDWRLSDLTLSGYAKVEHREDTEAYSPQFFGDARRREVTTTLGARGRLPLSRDLTLVMDAGWDHTRSDIALFDNRRWELEARLAWRW